ncbi:MAG: vitamin K epoxide reductase family protein [Pseudomonadota bacterium]
MLTKNNILTLSLILTLLLSLSMGLQDLAHLSACGSASCEKVHASSFGSMFGVPLGLCSAPGLLMVLFFHLKKKKNMVSCALAAMLGAEIYLTFVQLYFIHGICLYCLSFLGLLFLSFFLAVDKSMLPKAGLITCLFFFSFHFFFFFPDFQPRCTLAQIPADTRVEVFGSPSCPHCKEAITQLKAICSDYGADLVLRPVPLSPADYEPTLDWVCSLFFEKKTESARKVGLKIVWENERRLKELEPENETTTALPVILVTTSHGARLFRGWHERFTDSLCQLLENDALVGKVDMTTIGHITGKVCAPKTCN